VYEKDMKVVNDLESRKAKKIAELNITRPNHKTSSFILSDLGYSRYNLNDPTSQYLVGMHEYRHADL
jgi:hypothetical protein